MKKLLLIFALMLASCGDPCNCEHLSSDPFNLSTLPNGCGCAGAKLYVPDIGGGSDVDAAKEVTGTIDIQSKHKVK